MKVTLKIPRRLCVICGKRCDKYQEIPGTGIHQCSWECRAKRLAAIGQFDKFPEMSRG